MENHVKSNTFVTLLVAIKYMEKHHIWELTFDGIVVNVHLFAIGYFVEKDLPDQMNCKGKQTKQNIFEKTCTVGMR